jgi:hypothetical protein
MADLLRHDLVLDIGLHFRCRNVDQFANVCQDVFTNRHVSGDRLVECSSLWRQVCSFHRTNTSEIIFFLGVFFPLLRRTHNSFRGIVLHNNFLLAFQLVDLRNPFVFYVIHSPPISNICFLPAEIFKDVILSLLTVAHTFSRDRYKLRYNK